jgi:hypothetical protein
MQDKRKTVAFHEASHAVVAYLLGLEVTGVDLLIDKQNDTIEGEVEMLRGINAGIDPIVDKSGKGWFSRRKLFYRWLVILSAGHLGGFIFAGNEDFWKVYKKKEFMDRDEMKTLKRYVRDENLKRAELESILFIANCYLSMPPVWGLIERVASRLVRELKIRDLIGSIAARKIEPVEPPHHPMILIMHILAEVFPKE